MIRVVLIIATACCAWEVLAQSIGGLAVEPSPALANQTVRIEINAGAEQSACGLEINFGDGTVRQVRGDSFPVTVEYVYAKQGVYALAVTGRGMVRGLRSLVPCKGSQSVALQVNSLVSGAAQPVSPATVDAKRSLGNVSEPLVLGGMSLSNLSPEQARRKQFPAESYLGLAVETVAPDSPAAAAGLVAGDVLSHLQDQGATLQLALQASGWLRQGRPVKATFFRNGSWFSVTLSEQVSAASSAASAHQTPPNAPGSASTDSHTGRPGITAGRHNLTQPTRGPADPVSQPSIGLNFMALDQETASRLRFPIDQYKGLLLQSISPNSPASTAGLAAGDVLTHIDDEAVSPEGIEKAAAKLAEGIEVKVGLFRAGQWMSGNLVAQVNRQEPAPAQRSVSKGEEFLKNLFELGKAFDEIGRAWSSAKTQMQQSARPAESRPAGGAGAQSAAAASPACSPGAQLEPREFTQPEILGRPQGERAQMCFFRMEGSRAEYLNFFSTGHFYHTSISGSGGFASAGAVYGTVRGSYGFQPGSVLATRIGYLGTGVSQSNRGAGTQRDLNVSGQSRLDNEMTLPNCQKITYRDEAKRVQYDRSASHPSYLIVDGVRWERYSIDCPAWKGWARD